MLLVVCSQTVTNGARGTARSARGAEGARDETRTYLGVLQMVNKPVQLAVGQLSLHESLRSNQCEFRDLLVDTTVFQQLIGIASRSAIGHEFASPVAEGHESSGLQYVAKFDGIGDGPSGRLWQVSGE